MPYVGCPTPIRQKVNQVWNSEPGTRAAAVGRVAGLIPAVMLIAHWLFTQSPEIAELFSGYLALALLYLSPYLLALIASRVRDLGVRSGLLIGVGLLSLVASFPILSSLFFVLLPATFIIWFPAVRSLTASEHLLVIAAPATGAGLLTARLLGFSFFNLLWMGNEDQKGRCWALTRGDDLSSRWESRPSVGDPEGRGVWVSGVDLWAMCASRTTEAWISIGAVAAALMGMAVVSRWSGLPV